MLTHHGPGVFGGGADHTLNSQLHAAIVTPSRNQRDSRTRKEQELPARTAAYPFSPVRTPIQVSWAGGPAAYAMCAIDALGITGRLLTRQGALGIGVAELGTLLQAAVATGDSISVRAASHSSCSGPARRSTVPA